MAKADAMLRSDPELYVRGLMAVMFAIEQMACIFEEAQFWHAFIHGDGKEYRDKYWINDNVSRETNGGE